MENNLDKHFKGQQKNEKYICFFRHHWVGIVKEIFYLLTFTLLALIAWIKMGDIQGIMRGDVEMKLTFMTIYIAITLLFHRTFLNLLNYFLKIGIITNMRIIDHQKTLYFVDNVDSIDMGQIQNVERLKQGIMPHILGYGDIKIFLNASAMIKTLNSVPNVKYHFRCTNRQKEYRQTLLHREHHNQLIPTERPRITSFIEQKPQKF